MYTATMEYRFDGNRKEKVCLLWRDRVLKLAERQPGFVRMQFLTSEDSALAVGTWESRSHAEEFMKTGVFRNLMEELKPLLAAEPIPRSWELTFYSQA